MPRTLQPCGTEAAYNRHRYHDEEPCGPCKAAWAAYQQGWRAASAALRDNHRAEFEALLKAQIEEAKRS